MCTATTVTVVLPYSTVINKMLFRYIQANDAVKIGVQKMYTVIIGEVDPENIMDVMIQEGVFRGSRR